MSTAGDQDVFDFVARTSQIIAAALIAGMVMMLGVSVALAPIDGARPGAGGAPQASGAPGANADPQPAAVPTNFGETLAWIAVAVAAAGLTLSVLVPRWIADRNRRSIAAGTWVPPGQAGREAPGTPTPSGPEPPETDADKRASVYPTQFIAGAALIEGPAFFASIAYLIGANPIALGLALLLVGAMIARFPTRPRIASWIDRQQEWLLGDRQAAS